MKKHAIATISALLLVAALTAGRANATIYDSSLVGWWTMDQKDMTSGRFNDMSGNGNSGYILNIATSSYFSSGKIGMSGTFNGSSGSVVIPQSASINNLTSMTVSAWIYVRSAGEGGLGKIVAKNGVVGIANSWQFMVSGPALATCGNDTNTIVFQHNSSAGTLLAQGCSVANAITLNRWMHAVVTWDGVSTIAKIYLNGSRSVGNASGGAGSVTPETIDVYIGNSSADARTFDGFIDDVRIYNRVLSDAEVAQLYYSSAVTHYSPF